MPKVSILVGGPDWPTSVITGILDLPMWPMLLGTMPVMIIIAPCCVATGFLLCPEEVFGPKDINGNQPAICSSLNGTLLLISAVIQQSATFAALYYAQVLLDHMKESGELDENWMKDPQEDEIMELVRQDEKYAKIYASKSQWGLVPTYIRINLVLGCLLSVVVYATNFFGGSFGYPPYKTFEVSDSIGEELDGNFLNIVNPLGWVQNVGFFISCINLREYYKWVDQAMSGVDLEDSMKIEMTEQGKV